MKKMRGVYEKVPGSGVWWVRYADASGRIRREVAGARSAALALYQKRKTAGREGKKLPERLRSRSVSFAELAKDALEFSKTHERSYRDDRIRMAKIVGWLGDRPAESVTPQEIERWLSSKTHLEPGTLNRYRALLSSYIGLECRTGKCKLIRPV